ncbi:MAG: SIMPL domain-containing protein [Gemmatimonadota bacterium]|jgi:uncharacterized protein YggE
MRTIIPVLAALSATACSAAARAPLGAQTTTPDESQPRTVTVSANASVARIPDRARIHLAVESPAETARQASEANARAMDAVLRAVRELGIDPGRIQTRRLELRPRYDRPREGEPRIVGYTAVNQVQVRIDDLDRVGPVVDAAVGAGANQVTGIDFELSDPSEAYHEALRTAIDRARDEAGVAADALGETLGPPLQVSTGGLQVPTPTPRYRMEALSMAADAAPPVEAGELQVQAHVTIVFLLGT